uniref:Ras-associating domain-containing protein n=1 Tax=Daphnia galeata TaxID=27404 RepID=A0A8J2RF38_9CRUS|nr:unnamed protein product [Daphnia galeata]
MCMLKHVHLSPYRSSMMSHHAGGGGGVGSGGRSDTLSLNSTMSCSSLSNQDPLSSRSSSYTSLNESSHNLPQHPPSPMTTVKIYCRCLRPDIEYKTLVINYQTSCKELIMMLLNKAKMKHRDPKLFYLTMEVGVRKSGAPVRTLLVLDDDACPAELQACYPRGGSRFSIQMRRGGLVRVHDSVLMPNSQYKSLLISERTTIDDLIELLLRCHSNNERIERFSIYEVCNIPGYEHERKLHPDDLPLNVQTAWKTRFDCGNMANGSTGIAAVPNANMATSPQSYFSFVLKRNPDNSAQMARRRLPWSKSLDISTSESSSSASSTSDGSETALIPRSSSYHDYENYFYI